MGPLNGGTSHPSILMIFVVLLCFGYGAAQVPPPAVDGTTITPCKIYNMNTGLVDSGTAIADVIVSETDQLTNPRQAVNLPIVGGLDISDIVIETDSTTTPSATDLNIDFQLDANGVYWQLVVPEPVDRDVGLTSSDDFEYLSFNVRCYYLSATFQPVNTYIDVKVTVEDVNDNPPEFSEVLYNVNMYEQTPVMSTVFGEILAQDRDKNENKDVFYSIVSGNDYNGREVFRMSSQQTGSIVLADVIDFEELAFRGLNSPATQFELLIRARDNAADPALRQSSTATVRITVLDSDDLSPTFWHPSCLSSAPFLTYSCDSVNYKANIFSASSAIGFPRDVTAIPLVTGSDTTEYPILAMDQDVLNAAIQFSIVESVPSQFANSFTISTSGPLADVNWPGRDVYQATLRQTQPIQRSQASSFILRVRAQQSANPTYKYRIAEVQVSVQPVNNNPPVVTGSSVGYIWENNVYSLVRESENGPTLRLTITDADLQTGQIYDYAIIGNVPFEIESAGSIVFFRNTQPLDRETTAVYSFTLQVTETGVTNPKSTTFPVTINVLDDNDNQPQFVPGSAYSTQILEGDYSAFRELLSNTIQATDADIGLNGAVVFRKRSVAVVTGVTDFDGTTLDAMVTVENNGDAYLQGNVPAGLVFYVFVDAQDTPAQGQVLTSTAVLTVYVVSSDHAGQNPPVFILSDYTFYVAENTPGATPIGVIRATDIDPVDSSLSYSIVSGELGFFGLNPSTGTQGATVVVAGVACASPLNYEQDNEIIFVVRAEDSSAQSATATVTVIIMNVNDNTPQFDQASYRWSVPEGQASALPVGTVGASDADNDPIFFSVEQATFSSLTGTISFIIDSSTGQVFVNGPLDYERRNQFTFNVRVTDQANNCGGLISVKLTSTALLTVDVLSTDQNPPVFVHSDYTFYVAENTPGATPIGVIRATPLDSSLSYSIVSGELGFFSLNPSTGPQGATVVVSGAADTSPLDYEHDNEIIFIVRAEDSSAQSSTVTVRINLLHSDDLPPTFWHSNCLSSVQSIAYSCDSVNYNANILSANSTIGFPRVVTTIPRVTGSDTTEYPVLAMDQDALNAAIQFSIVESVPQQFTNSFAISTTGPLADVDNNWPGRDVYQATLFQVQPIQRSQATSFIVRVRAEQSANPTYKYRIAEVHVTVQPVGNNPPDEDCSSIASKDFRNMYLLVCYVIFSHTVGRII